MSLQTADRAIAIDMIKFFVGILTAAALLIVLGDPFSEVFAQSAGTGHEDVEAGRQYVQQAWSAAPVVAVLFALLALIVAAAFRGGGR